MHAQDSQRAPLMAPRSGDQHEAPPAAVEHYNRGRELYQAGRYREAVDELSIAARLDPGSANLVYNLARVYELLGEIDLAIRNYERYRDMLPREEMDERERVQGTLQRLRGARDELVRDEVREPASAPAVAAQPPQRGVADAAFWSVAGSAAATLLVGGAVGIFALKAERDVEHFTLGFDGDVSDRKREARHADRLALTSDVLLLTGSALGVTSILLFALRTKPRNESSAQVDVTALPGGALLRVGGRL